MNEKEVRALRDRVFCHRCCDMGWRNIRDNWMKPENILWLQEHNFPLP